jgi:hypothetical protein
MVSVDGSIRWISTDRRRYRRQCSFWRGVTPLAVLLMARRDSLNSTLAAEDKLFNKAAWRLIPVLFICYFAAYLDRVNVGFAELQMKADLKFSDTVCPALCSTPTSSGRRLTYDFTCE